MNLLSLLSFASTEDIHISLRAEDNFELFGISITNSMLYGAFVAIAIGILMVYVSRRATIKPQRGLVQLVEMFMEFMTGLLDGVFNSRKKALKYAPIFGVFFLFIFLSNLSGLLPLVGEGFTINEHPLFRPFTADLNGTIALSVVGIITVQYLSIKESGVRGHLKHYFTNKPFNPINFFIGILEVFGELTRIMSLSLRLFLNTAVGEILIAVFAYVGQNFGSFTILPIALFEILVAGIQAYVFTVLCATYLAIAIHHDEHDVPETSNHSADNITGGKVPAAVAVNG